MDGLTWRFLRGAWEGQILREKEFSLVSLGLLGFALLLDGRLAEAGMRASPFAKAPHRDKFACLRPKRGYVFFFLMVVIAILLVAGILLLVSEIFLPGMIAGSVGCLCLAAAVLLGFQEFGPVGGSGLLVGVLVALLAGFIFWLWWFPGSKVSKPFVSKGEIGEIGTDRPDLLGKEGVALTPLRPSGTAIIDQCHVDVVTAGEMIEKDKRVKVIHVEGMRVVVRQI